MRRLGAVMDWLARRVAKTFFFASLLLASYGAFFHARTGLGATEAPWPMSAVMLVGLVGVLASFLSIVLSQRDGPTVPMVAFVYAFGSTLVLVLLRRLDAAAEAEIAWLPYVESAARTVAFGSIAMLAWVMIVGGMRGWNRWRVEPWPVSRLVRLVGRLFGRGDRGQGRGGS